MGKGMAIVKFPDGTLMYGVYYGTSDVLRGDLVCKIEDLSFKYDPNMPVAVSDPYVEEVEIATNYGGGFWWKGTASKVSCCVVDGIHPYGLEGLDGEFIIPWCDIHEGYPDWWPSD